MAQEIIFFDTTSLALPPQKTPPTCTWRGFRLRSIRRIGYDGIAMIIFRITPQTDTGGFVPPYAGGDPVPPRGNNNSGIVPPWLQHPIIIQPMPPGWDNQPAADGYTVFQRILCETPA